MRIGWRSGVAACGIWMALAPAGAQPNPAMQNPTVTKSTNSPPKTETPPLPGANSFTEGQARKSLESQGYVDVSPLVNDSQGIWRGTAMSGSKKVHVSVDYKGNVSAKPE
ncbi:MULTISPECIES: hypothetical protein [Tardiphaga]|uniref:PepSY domain-containing protein n=1 Tax=Tardiphaga robiniae TaxID=943830 RepID=A0A7G6TW30_9BRAD|nr:MULTISPECIES: hypothetical protein [Tardiphaga]QND70962.1 hypothetical protein HB776_06720 [Tardiphaga robiniae]WPO39371.1 hypothetical protein SFY93_17615 [Tardiphaga sp. 42S5]